MDASIIIRTYNEAKWLPSALEAVSNQIASDLQYEVVVVDSGSTDSTLEIAKRYDCRIVHIDKSEFTFGRSLNIGCDAASGRNLVFISGHCIPDSQRWLTNLVVPLDGGVCSYVYGRQYGQDGKTKFSEEMLFRKYYPEESSIPQDGFFCNNACAAIPKSIWKANPFDETVTGLEDMVLAKRLVLAGLKIGYVASAPVVHIHEENWSQVKMRYEREAIALQEIMPEVHVQFIDFVRYTFAGIFHDWSHAVTRNVFWRSFVGVIMFRFLQYWGTYRGNNDHRKISRLKKERYFYPR
ncbi:MAG: glycosyltransferase family 2 protein [Maricaulis sp.]|nr:glycosyltransferase family 2 protein [Maricaulis sp.]